jgi:hypothetical protein
VSSAKTDIFIGNNATAAFVLTEAPVTVDLYCNSKRYHAIRLHLCGNTRTLTFDFAREPGILFTSSI